MDHRRHPVRRFEDLSPRQKAIGAVSVLIQVSLAVTAWVDLARRPPEQVRGRQPLWAAVIAINYVGPALYFWRVVHHHAKTIP